MFRELKGTRMQIGGQEQLQTKDDSGYNNNNNNNNPETENREASFTKTLSNKTKLALRNSTY
jgi:hypothetical protein